MIDSMRCQAASLQQLAYRLGHSRNEPEVPIQILPNTEHTFCMYVNGQWFYAGSFQEVETMIPQTVVAYRLGMENNSNGETKD